MYVGIQCSGRARECVRGKLLLGRVSFSWRLLESIFSSERNRERERERERCKRADGTRFCSGFVGYSSVRRAY